MDGLKQDAFFFIDSEKTAAVCVFTRHFVYLFMIKNYCCKCLYISFFTAAGGKLQPLLSALDDAYREQSLDWLGKVGLISHDIADVLVCET